MDNELELMTIKEVMVVLKVRESKVRKMVLNKEIKYLKIGSLIRFRKSDIQDYLNENLILPSLKNGESL